ncbi:MULTISPECIES: hypothetical protein [Shewanella]|uniref:hypothetical protein n=1 Tax=Shewanella TaxID=22 RepID=UPI0009DDE8AE|nr:hypothetical protein [Shewanella sp. 38A_GOM-205m]
MLKFSVILTVILCCSISPALANYHCEVDVHRVLVYGNGTVNVLHSGRGDYTVICNANGTWNNIDTVTCSLWVATLQMAQNNNKKAIFYYSGDGRCDTLPTYGNAPAPIYIGSIK